MDIATELPSCVFSRLLGFHQNTADNRTQEHPGASPKYAADPGKR
ncbi:hypothetical protein [Streptomyces humicola]|nr:hypothetical protein [Streptomyces humicola]